MIKPKLRFSIFLLGVLLTICSCKNNGRNININKVSIQSELFRFDELLTQNGSISPQQWQTAQEAYPQFISVFDEQILGIQDQDPVLVANQFKSYFDSTGLLTLVRQEFTNFPEFETFKDVQKRLKVLVPRYQSQDVVTMVSGFNYKTILLDSALAVGLEFYLGDKIQYEELPNGIFSYQIHRFNRNYIVPDLTTSVVDDLFPDEGEFNTFLKKILYEGKKLYLKEQVQPQEDKAVIIGMTDEEYQWCVDNELQIWQYFIAEELLYSNDLQRYKTYVMDGPFSAGMPEGAPANTGIYIGWKIINSYMNNNKVSVDQLFANTNDALILKDSGYRP